MLWLFFIAVFSADAHATGAACSWVDLRGELGTPRVQDGTSWCYAHSAADLLTQAVGQRVSSVDIATTYLMGDEQKLKKSKSKELRTYLKEHPEFWERLRESRKEDEAYHPDKILSPDGILDTGGKDDEAIVLSNLKGLCLAGNLPSGLENMMKYLDAIREDLSEEEDDRPDIVPSPIGEVQNDVARIMAHAFQKWVDQKCGKRLHPKKALLPHEVSVADNLEEFEKRLTAGKIDRAASLALLVEELDRVLDSGRPAAIGYESYDLYPHAGAKQNSPHGDHSSVVAARKKIGNKCYYFVRNHFGTTCGYREEFEESCEKENGGVWVPAEALKHLYSVISVR